MCLMAASENRTLIFSPFPNSWSVSNSSPSLFGTNGVFHLGNLLNPALSHPMARMTFFVIVAAVTMSQPSNSRFKTNDALPLAFNSHQLDPSCRTWLLS